MNRLDGFNRVAPWYDLLKRLVFGSAIMESEKYFLTALPVSGNFLVLGGGSGEILNWLLQDRPTARVWYIEASSVMLARARKKVPADRETCVTFVHGTEHDIPAGQQFDGVITHFFLDLFPDGHLKMICPRISSQLKDEGVWLVSDFVDSSKTWQRLMLWLMYRFFAFTSRITATRLPHWESVLMASGLRQIGVASFYGKFIKSGIYARRMLLLAGGLFYWCNKLSCISGGLPTFGN